MSRKANTKLIGLFVVIGVFLLVVGIGYFGSGRFLAESRLAVAYFDEGLKGLNEGAPVLFRGVRVGSVVDVVVEFDEDSEKYHFPVYLEIDRSRIKNAPELDPIQRQQQFEELLQKGLRAQLDIQSFLTGMLVVQLNFFPDTELVLKGAEPGYVEIPTVPSNAEELAQFLKRTVKNIEALPIEDLLDDARYLVQGLDAIVRSDDVAQTIKSLNTLLVDADALTREINSHVPDLSSSVVATANEARITLTSVRERIEVLQVSASGTLEQARSTLATAEELIAEDSQLHYRLTRALDELAATLQSIGVLMEFVERHPEAFLQGKNVPGGQ